MVSATAPGSGTVPLGTASAWCSRAKSQVYMWCRVYVGVWFSECTCSQFGVEGSGTAFEGLGFRGVYTCMHT